MKAEYEGNRDNDKKLSFHRITAFTINCKTISEYSLSVSGIAFSLFGKLKTPI